jgi:hypothetical protein
MKVEDRRRVVYLYVPISESRIDRFIQKLNFTFNMSSLSHYVKQIVKDNV